MCCLELPEASQPALVHTPGLNAGLFISAERVSTVYARTLRRAADYAGGVEGLARQLKVKAVHLIAWIEGVETPPMEIFLKAVDIVTERSIPSPLDSPPSRDASVKKPGS
jgi:hypothetical protein